MQTRDPGAVLRPYVRTMWATPAPERAASVPTSPSGAPGAERVLPTGVAHVVFRLSDEPLRVYDGATGPEGTAIERAVVGGARSTAYLRSVAEPTGSVGVQLRAGAAEVLVGVPAGELAGRHVSLSDLWGPAAERARMQLVEAGRPERQLDLLESMLTARLSEIRGLHPAVAEALARLRTSHDVRAAVRATGYSHRRLVELFRRSVGLPPKQFCRIRRFQGVLRRLAATPAASWAELAAASGYSDQSHLHREFREFAGVTPGAYRRLVPRFPNHVPLARVAYPRA